MILQQRCARKGTKEIGNNVEQKSKILKKNTEDHNGQIGRGRKVCKFYKELDSILGHRPASVPTVLLDTGITNSTSSAAEPGDNSTEQKKKLKQMVNHNTY